MATKKNTALTKTSGEEAEAAALAELSEYFDGVDVDGMGDVGGEDIALAAKVFNMGGLDKNGNARQRNVFFDTITETEQTTIECVLLLTRKSHRWDEYNNAEEKTEVHCASDDRVTGTMRLPVERDGDQRTCKKCPDRGWFKDPEGKPTKRCGEVHTVVGVEHATGRPFLIRFKKTGLKPFRSYLMQHHYSARKAVNAKTGQAGRGHIPLFAYECTVALEMHSSGNYALPVLRRGSMLSKDRMDEMHESARGYLEIIGEVLAHAEVVDTKHVAVSDAGLGADDFAD